MARMAIVTAYGFGDQSIQRRKGISTTHLGFLNFFNVSPAEVDHLDLG